MSMIAEKTQRVPRPDDGGCPSWCTGDGDGHEWEEDGRTGWARLHGLEVGMFSLGQGEYADTHERRFSAVTPDTDLFTTAQTARDLAAELEQVAVVLDMLEGGER